MLLFRVLLFRVLVFRALIPQAIVFCSRISELFVKCSLMAGAAADLKVFVNAKS